MDNDWRPDDWPLPLWRAAVWIGIAAACALALVIGVWVGT